MRLCHEAIGFKINFLKNSLSAGSIDVLTGGELNVVYKLSHC